MAISTFYKDALRERVVTDFVKSNSRAPTTAELNRIIFENEQAYPNVDEVGIAGYDLKRARRKDASSASMENTNRKALMDDMKAVGARLSKMEQFLEDSHRGFYGTGVRAGRMLDRTETRLDNLLLLASKSDVFVAGVEETFNDQEHVDFANSTATVESGFVTIGRTGYTPVDLQRVRFSATTAGSVPIVGTSASSNINSLKEDDGDIWEYTVFTQSQQGRVSLILQVEFPDSTYVGDVRLTGIPIGANKQTTVTCFYSLEGSSYVALEPYEEVQRPEMSFQIGLDGVKKLQIVLSKDAADSFTSGRNRYMYVFALDSFKVYADAFQTSRRSELICGPYYLKDATGSDVNFTKAIFDACTIEPTDTSISFYLSTDGVNYIGTSYSGDSGSYLSFADGSSSQSMGFIDATIAGGSLVESVDGLEVKYEDEAVLNTFVSAAWTHKLAIPSIVFKRNVKAETSPDLVYQISPGWMFDPDTSQYSCTVYIENPEGRYIDFGSTSCFVNGVEVSGEVFFPSGYSRFATSDGNWLEIESGVPSLTNLRNADSLYPYNHKYLVEGYNYTSAFVGDQVYIGATQIFGTLLTYRSPEEFAYAQPGDPGYMKMFTLEEANDNWYIKVKVDKTDASWSSESFSVDWQVHASDSNTLWVKALMSTSRSGQTPKIDSFKVRVI